ncbi:hypothetical protein GLYMA_11G091350v4 [Glycine max]|nr:hypothetical protein GLYMA_11G091350v4 [Glycine max]
MSPFQPTKNLNTKELCTVKRADQLLERNAQLLPQIDVFMTSVEEVPSSAKPQLRQIQKLPKKIIASLPQQEVCFSLCFSLLLSAHCCKFSLTS